MKKPDTLNLFSSTTIKSHPRNAPRTRMSKTQLTPASQDAVALWAQCLDIVRDNVSQQVFRTWFEQVKALKWDGTQLTVEVPSQFFCEWIEEHYSALLRKTLQKVLGAKASLQYQVVLEDDDQSTSRTIKVQGLRPNAGQQPTLPFGEAPLRPQQSAHYLSFFNQRYVFENFIRGETNQLAASAAMAVADNPGRTRYNPLVVYGPTGVGKTHLVQAVGNRILQRNRNARVLYTNSEKFTMEYINAIQTNKVTDFTNFYRSVDVLIVDDIQFLGGKERTQDSFFHTFNALHQAGKQLILTSDKQPRDLADVDERLISRFQWGLIADIQPPDFETRMAILQQKSLEEGMEIPGDILEYIAQHVTSSVREMEGSLISLLAKISLDNRPMSLELVREVVRGVSMRPRLSEISVEAIKKEVATYYNLKVDLLAAKSRKHDIMLARHIAIYLCKSLTKLSLKSIGAHFGGRDHSTVLHSCSTVVNFMETDKKVRQDVMFLLKTLQEP